MGRNNTQVDIVQRSLLREKSPEAIALKVNASSVGADKHAPISARFSSGVYPRGIQASCDDSDTVLDLDGYVAWVSGSPISLRPMEQRLLSLLEQSPNRVVRTRDIVVALYGNIPIEAGRNRLKRLVADIRMRLGPGIADRLRTVHGVGLVLKNVVAV